MLFLESQILQGINVNLDSILSKKNELAYGEKVLFDLYDSFMTSEIQQNIQTVIWVASIYCIIVLFMYFFIYIPVVNTVKEEITKVWRLGRLIPIEHRNKIMEAFKQASRKKKFSFL